MVQDFPLLADLDLCDTMIELDDAFAKLQAIGRKPFVYRGELSNQCTGHWGGQTFLAHIRNGWVSLEEINRSLASYGTGLDRIEA